MGERVIGENVFRTFGEPEARGILAPDLRSQVGRTPKPYVAVVKTRRSDP